MLRGDPLDDALADLRITGSVLLHESYDPEWAIAIPDESGLRRLLGVDANMRVVPFHLIRRGGCDLTAADGGHLRLDEPELSLVPGGAAHQLAVGRRAAVVSLEDILAGGGPPANAAGEGATELVCGAFVARAAPLNPLLGALPSLLKVMTGGAGASVALSGVTSLLAAELGRRSRNSFTAQRLLEIMAAEAVRSYQQAQALGPAGWFRALADPRIADAVRRIHAAPGDAWSVERLAAGAALSPSRFAARFRDAMGQSVMSYLARWRANVACRLLRDSDMPLTEITNRVGYDSLAAFSRAFKTWVGTPPAEWRKSRTRLLGTDNRPRTATS